MKALTVPVLVLLALDACSGPRTVEHGPEASPARLDAIHRLAAATNVVHELRAISDAYVPRAAAASAHCVAVVPGLVHAGLFVGARVGRGVASCREGRGWSPPTFLRITSASAGLEAGLESVDVVMLMMTVATEAKLLDGKAQLGATTSVAVGPVGREAQASSDVTLSSTVLYYSRASGLFVGLDLSGTVLEADEESSRAFYGDPRDFRALLRTPPDPPPAAKAFLDEMVRSFPSASP